MEADDDSERAAILERFGSLRQYQKDGQRAPHKPLLVLLALGWLERTGTSRLRWSEAKHELGNLITEFGRPSKASPTQSAAYPFTRLRSDGVWVLDPTTGIPDDDIGSLDEHDVVGRLEPALEARLRADQSLLRELARDLVTSQFPATVVPDVLASVGLEPDAVLQPVLGSDAGTNQRRPATGDGRGTR